MRNSFLKIELRWKCLCSQWFHYNCIKNRKGIVCIWIVAQLRVIINRLKSWTLEQICRSLFGNPLPTLDSIYLMFHNYSWSPLHHNHPYPTRPKNIYPISRKPDFCSNPNTGARPPALFVATLLNWIDNREGKSEPSRKFYEIFWTSIIDGCVQLSSIVSWISKWHSGSRFNIISLIHLMD